MKLAQLVERSFLNVLSVYFLSLTSIGLALTTEEESASLARARNAYSKGDCVDTILEVAGTSFSKSPNSNLAKYYKAVCQDQLGDPASSYQTAILIQADRLDSEKRSTVQNLIKKLSAVPESKPFSVTLSGGAMNFSKDVTFTSGTFTDLVAYYGSASNSLTIGAETVGMKQVSGASYSQQHWLVVGEHRFIDAIGLKLGYRNQSSSSATVDGSTNTLASLRWFNSSAQLGGTYAVSAYDKYYPGKLEISQITVFGSYSLGDLFGSGLFTLDAKAHQINPKMNYNPKLTNSVALQEAYNSTEATLRYSLPAFSIAATVWSGEQVFAVLSDAAVVFSNATVHTGGQKLSVDYYYLDVWSAGVLYGSEAIKDISTGIIGQSTVTSLSTSIYF